MTDAERDRAMGAWLGLAVGDAVGTTIEFRARDEAPPLTDMVGGGPFDLAAGEWTDDTSMAWALAASLAATPEFDAVDLMTRFLAWWREGAYSSNGRCFDIGMTVAGSLERFERGGGPSAGPTEERTAGNGSLMRLAPVVLWGLGRGEARTRNVAREQSRTTHGAPACLDACEAFAVMLRDAVRGAPRERVLREAGRMAAGGEIGDILAGAWRGKARAEIRSSGYVGASLEAAMWCVERTDGFAPAVLMAANLGEDADTTAAVTGQLAGALHGAAGIPRPWLDRLARRAELEAAGVALLG